MSSAQAPVYTAGEKGRKRAWSLVLVNTRMINMYWPMKLIALGGTTTCWSGCKRDTRTFGKMGLGMVHPNPFNRISCLLQCSQVQYIFVLIYWWSGLVCWKSFPFSVTSAARVNRFHRHYINSKRKHLKSCSKFIVWFWTICWSLFVIQSWESLSQFGLWTGIYS